MLRKLFAADVESVEGIGAVGAVFEQVFFGLCEFFNAFVLAETVATARDPGGYELRNPYLKGCIPPKDVTTIRCGKALDTIRVFEGFFDFLSALTLGYDLATADALVLNSLFNLDKSRADLYAVCGHRRTMFNCVQMLRCLLITCEKSILPERRNLKVKWVYCLLFNYHHLPPIIL